MIDGVSTPCAASVAITPPQRAVFGRQPLPDVDQRLGQRVDQRVLVIGRSA